MPWYEIFGLDSADSVREEELAVYRACRGGPARRDRIHGHRELPRARDRSAKLPERCAHASARGDQRADPVADDRGSGSGNHSKNNNSGNHCSCTTKKTTKVAPNKWWPFARLKNLLCGLKEPEDLAAQNKWNNQVTLRPSGSTPVCSRSISGSNPGISPK